MNIIFMGTPDFAVPVLQTLIDKIEINGKLGLWNYEGTYNI